MNALPVTVVDADVASATAPRGCPVCRSRIASSIHRQRYALFDDSALPRETTIVACDACTMVYARSEATAGAYRRHYAEHSKYATSGPQDAPDEAPRDAARFDATAAFVTRGLPKTASVLDIGAGRGGLLRALRRAGFARVVGLDPSPDCVAAMRTSGVEAGVAELEDDAWPTDPERFDVVVLSHVLEHVFDVDDAFARIVERVAHGGAVYVEVPDATRYTLDGFPPFYFFDPEHINHFDAASLQRLATRHGWTTAERFPRVLDVGAGQRYPAIGVLLRRADGIVASRTTPLDLRAADAVRGYVDRSAVAMKQVAAVATIDGLAAGRASLVVWGAGSHAQRLLAGTALGRCAIECIIDADSGKQGRRLDGFPVVAPDEGLLCAAERSAPIAVAIAVGADAVVDRLRCALPSTTVVRL